MAEPTDTLFSTPEMSAAFSSSSHLQAMLAFESGLARAQGRLGVIPESAAEAIAAKCGVENFDIAAIYEDAARSASPVVPLVKRLIALVDGEAQKYAHWGATSQDAMDTALMLQMRSGLSLLYDGLSRVCERCAQLAEEHRQTIMAGRTLLQQAVPITFGLKAARWLAMTQRRLESLRELRNRALAVQLGGAAGTLAAYGRRPTDADRAAPAGEGLQIVEELASELELPVPDLPWHAEHDRVAEIAGQVGVAAGAMAKIAGDLVLLAQTEVAEVAVGAGSGKGGSSAMPQKRNPVDAVRALAASRLAIGEVPVIISALAQGHERGAGDWQSEWSAVPDLFRHTACAVEAVGQALQELKIDTRRMAENLERSKGSIMAESLTMALASRVGRPAAQQLVGELCRMVERSGSSLAAAAKGDARVAGLLAAEQVDRALDPANYLGSTEALIRRSLDAFRKNRSIRGEQ